MLIVVAINTGGYRQVLGMMVGDTPNSPNDEVHSHVRAILEAPHEETARMLLRKTASFYEDEAPKAMSILEAGFYHAAAVRLLPEKYRKRLYATNSIPGLKEEIRKREQLICIFPNRESVIRLARRHTHGKGREMGYRQEIH